MILPIHMIHTEVFIQAANHPTDTPEQIQQRVAEVLCIQPDLVAQAMAQKQVSEKTMSNHRKHQVRGIVLIEVIGILAAISIVVTGTTLAVTDKGPDSAERGWTAAQQWAISHRVTPVSTNCDLDHDADGYARCAMKDQRLTYVLQCATGLTAARGCRVMDVQDNE